MRDSITSADRLFVPLRFETVVARHIFKNVADLGTPVPQILGIHGPSGEGKTKQCETLLRRMNVDLVIISGGELEHKQAGRPGELIRDRYTEASNKFDLRSDKICALLINDFDTGIGIWSERRPGTIFQYTVNLQNVYATLMNLVDHPTTVDGSKCNRVPIIITGNDFGILHEPLTRDGRMTKFDWQPTLEEKRQVVQALYADLFVSSDELDRFVYSYQSKSVAFFVHVRSALIDDSISQAIQHCGLANVVQAALDGKTIARLKSIRYALCDLEATATRVENENVHTPNTTQEG